MYMRMRPKVPTKQHGRVAHHGVVCISYIYAAVVSRLQEIGGQSKSESTVLPIWDIKTNSLIVCWHLLGSRSTETICQNMCIDSANPSWIDKHGR